jgi:hypothetical protein
MQPEIIVVHDIQKSIDDVGVMPYANTLVQEMGGNYFYVEANLIDEKDVIPYGYNYQVQHIESASDDPKDAQMQKDFHWQYKIWPIPQRLAWFIIDCLKLKTQAALLGSNEYPETRQAVYITPGKKLFGKKIETLTEIPAELMPVVVERL